MVMIALVSCKKSFLEVADSAGVYREDYVKNLSSLEAFENGAYAVFAQSYCGFNSASYPELVADNIKPLSSPPQLNLAQYSWSQVKSNGETNNVNASWISNYLMIRSFSFVIEQADKYSAENVPKANYLKGQAFAMRALLHWKLVNTFAQSYGFTSDASHPGVPYVKTSDVSVKETRKTVAEVYDALITDLKTAIELLPEITSDTRFFNQMAARALLARVYLYKNDFSQAVGQARIVCDKVPLMTVAQGYPDGLFYNKPPNNTEILFQGSPGSNPETTFFGIFLSGAYVYFLPTNDIAGILNERASDVRASWVTQGALGWQVMKFPKSTTGSPALNTIPEADYYDPILRSSEMFLTVAEASAKTGDENTAKNYLNQIRRRSDPTIGELNLSGEALLSEIYRERRKELCFEGLRMFDIQRLKMDVIRVDALANAPKVLTYGSDKAIAPIPIPDVEQMGIPQNKGY